MAAAGAVNIINRIDDKILLGVIQREQLIRDLLAGTNGVIDVTGRGLMLGIQCTKPAGEIVAQAARAGVLALTAKDKVRLLPALNIPMELLQEAIEILKQVIAE